MKAEKTIYNTFIDVEYLPKDKLKSLIEKIKSKGFEIEEQEKKSFFKYNCLNYSEWFGKFIFDNQSNKAEVFHIEYSEMIERSEKKQKTKISFESMKQMGIWAESIR